MYPACTVPRRYRRGRFDRRVCPCPIPNAPAAAHEPPTPATAHPTPRPPRVRRGGAAAAARMPRRCSAATPRGASGSIATSVGLRLPVARLGHRDLAATRADRRRRGTSGGDGSAGCPSIGFGALRHPGRPALAIWRTIINYMPRPGPHRLHLRQAQGRHPHRSASRTASRPASAPASARYFLHAIINQAVLHRLPVAAVGPPRCRRSPTRS